DATCVPQRDNRIGGWGRISTADLDGDGKLDLVVARTEVTIWLGQAAGSFSRGYSSAPMPLNDRLLVADFNGDGRLDAFVADISYGSPGALFLGADGPSFDAPTPLGGFAVPGDRVTDIAAADIDGDGHVDLVSSAYDA